MPELPEIETVRRQLMDVLVGKKLVEIKVINPKTVQGDIKLAEGKKIVGVKRRAKVLLIDLEKEVTMAIHFKMSGQMIYEPKHQIPNPNNQLISKIKIQNIETRIVGGHPTKDFVNKLPSSHTRVIFNLSDGTLFFNDQRKFGWILINSKNEIQNSKFFQKLGPEPFEMTRSQFVDRVGRSVNRPIKLVIMDQEIIAGVGNIYANDALWEARMDPRTRVKNISTVRLGKLFNNIVSILKEGVKYGGATAADAKYMNLHGLGGHYQDHFRTYEQKGKICPRCGEKIVRVVLGGRGTFYCPGCQI